MRRIATALVAGLVLIFAQLAPAAAQGGKYHEAPALAEQVKAGKLPPVEQRLPEQPLVVPVVEKTGEYGGVWRRAFLGPADANNYSIRMYRLTAPAVPAAAASRSKKNCRHRYADRVPARI